MALTFPRTFSNLVTGIASYIDDNFNYIKTMFGTANGFATLDGSGKVFETANTADLAALATLATTATTANGLSIVNEATGTTALVIAGVKNGDRILVTSAAEVGSNANAIVTVVCDATGVTGVFLAAKVATQMFISAYTTTATGNAMMSVSGIFKATADGTLTLTQTTTASSGVKAVSHNGLAAFFLRKL